MAVPTFLTKNGSSDFLDKQKNLFDVLNSAEREKKLKTSTHDEFMEVEPQSNKRKRKETKQFRGKESLFKEPVDPPMRFRKAYRIPDFQKNPHKWTKYSLADITQEEMSNESNTAAALSFLREMKTQRRQQRAKVEVQKNESKSIPPIPRIHEFSLNQNKEKDGEEVSHKPVFKSSKLIMPEYVIGQSKKVNKLGKKKIANDRGKEIYLNHIHEYDDE